jgi:mRNA interferase MazF
MQLQNNSCAVGSAEMPVIRRGCIYNIEAGKNHPTGTEIWPNRPGLIVSNDAINEKAGFVSIVYLTTSSKRDMPYHVKIKSGRKMATALCEQVCSVDKSRLGFYIGEATPEEMQKINIALSLSLATVGTTYDQCSTIFKKWLLAMEKNHLDISGNPADEETSETDNEKDTKISALTADLARYIKISEEREKILKAQAQIIETLQQSTPA